jgi:hypothetical protein
MITIFDILAKHKAIRKANAGAPQPSSSALEASLAGEFGDWRALLDSFGNTPAPAKAPAPRPSREMPAPGVLEFVYNSKPLVLHTRYYLLSRDQASFLELQHAIEACRRSLATWKAKGATESGRKVPPAVTEGEEKFLKWLIIELNRTFPGPYAMTGVRELLPFGERLRKIMTFGCMDVNSYPGNANPLFLPAARNRCWASEYLVPPPNPMTLSRNNTVQLALLARQVNRSECAECLGFAIAAAGCLLECGFQAKFSVVTDGMHQFVVYYPDQGSPVIIDLWLGSVGQLWCWTEWSSYPFGTNFRPLYEVDRRGSQRAKL